MGLGAEVQVSGCPIDCPPAAPRSLRLWTSSEWSGCTKPLTAHGPGWCWELALLPGLASSPAGLTGVDSGKKKSGGRRREKKKGGGGCPSSSWIAPPIVEVAALVLCWSPGQIPQCLLDSYSNQFPLNSAGALFGRSMQELPSSYLKLGENLQKETIQVCG